MFDWYFSVSVLEAKTWLFTVRQNTWVSVKITILSVCFFILIILLLSQATPPSDRSHLGSVPLISHTCNHRPHQPQFHIHTLPDLSSPLMQNIPAFLCLPAQFRPCLPPLVVPEHWPACFCPWNSTSPVSNPFGPQSFPSSSVKAHQPAFRPRPASPSSSLAKPSSLPSPTTLPHPAPLWILCYSLAPTFLVSTRLAAQTSGEFPQPAHFSSMKFLVLNWWVLAHTPTGKVISGRFPSNSQECRRIFLVWTCFGLNIEHPTLPPFWTWDHCSGIVKPYFTNYQG